MTNLQAARATRILKILTDRTRIKIISLLIEAKNGGKDLCVKDIAEGVGISHSATSHQLIKLQDKRIVRSFRVGQNVCYKMENTTTTRILSHLIGHFK